MLEVKDILVGNFQNSPKLKSPVICENLLAVLKKEHISEADLSELQRVINEQTALLGL
ncbi:MAG: hypothetical protein K0S07_453 [Chlamydiales bacterium]|nr:hypothetical protein [Chlamydiales bacterium]